VRTTISDSTRREHDGTRTRDPSTSTMHTRHAFFGVIVSPKQSVGISVPWARQACRIVDPSGALTARSSMVSSTVRSTPATLTPVVVAARPDVRH